MTEEIKIHYNETTGDFFKENKILVGTITHNGFKQYCVNGSSFLGHRKAWEIFYGYIPLYVYHLDGNKHNNKIDNLYESHSIIRETKISEDDKYLYHCWGMIKQRCYNKKTHAYKDYGKRGIRVYSDWINNFPEFKKHVGHRPTKNHSIDRIDVNGNYEPGNIRWASVEEQAYNKRNTIKISGLTIKEISTKYGVSIDTIKYRIKAGMTFNQIIFNGSLRNIKRGNKIG